MQYSFNSRARRDELVRVVRNRNGIWVPTELHEHPEIFPRGGHLYNFYMAMDAGVAELLNVELADEVPGVHINFLAAEGGFPVNSLQRIIVHF